MNVYIFKNIFSALHYKHACICYYMLYLLTLHCAKIIITLKNMVCFCEMLHVDVDPPGWSEWRRQERDHSFVYLFLRSCSSGSISGESITVVVFVVFCSAYIFCNFIYSIHVAKSKGVSWRRIGKQDKSVEKNVLT